MSTEFDPSPRASKRRKTATYGVDRSTLLEQKTPDHLISRLRTRTGPNNSADEDHDSAYASKEDSLIEDEGQSVNLNPASKTDRRSNHAQTHLAPKTRGNQSLVENVEDVEEIILSRKRTPMKPALLSKGKKADAKKENGQRQDNQAGGEIREHDANVAGADGLERREVSHNENNLDTQQPRSSGRNRRRPGKFSDLETTPASTKALSAQAKPSTTKLASKHDQSPAKPKGILTPSKTYKKGPRKSVVFDQNEKQIEQQLGFKDINLSSKKRNAKAHDSLELGDKQAGILQVEENGSLEINEPSHFGFMAEELSIKGVVDDDELINQQLQSELQSGPSTWDEDPELLRIKSEVLSRVVTLGDQPLTHLNSQYNTVHSLLSATIAAGESNSLLLLGARGVGKTFLLETALKDLKKNHKDDFHTVRLNGFFQTDDRLALREIWRQLGREMHLSEDETGEISSYADTMASLLSLLSHPDELDTEVHEVPDIRKTSKSIIIILDEFDLFTTHPRQTLLYNLFDITQSKKAPLAVIGCSTRMDVVGCLEKRVKSRYSHRWLHIPSAKNLAAFEETIRATLLLDEQSSEMLGLSSEQAKWRALWNEYVKSLLLPSKTIQTLIQRIFYTTKSIPDLLCALYPIIAVIQISDPASKTSKSTPNLVPDYNLAALSVNQSASLVPFLPTLPTLHLSLMTAATRLETIHSLQSINFNLVYTHYTELIARSRLQQTASGAVAVGGAGLRLWGREVARSAWEDLVRHGVVTLVTGASKDGETIMGGEGESSRMYRIDVTLEEVEWAVKEKWNGGAGAGEVIGKWCREI